MDGSKSPGDELAEESLEDRVADEKARALQEPRQAGSDLRSAIAGHRGLF